jgi:hypothetical protein
MVEIGKRKFPKSLRGLSSLLLVFRLHSYFLTSDAHQRINICSKNHDSICQDALTKTWRTRITSQSGWRDVSVAEDGASLASAPLGPLPLHRIC